MRADRRPRVRLAASLTALLLLCLPAAAQAQAGGTPFGPLPPAQTATQPTTASTATTSTTTGTSSVSSTTVYLAAGGAIVLILAIGWFIARDARRVAPVSERQGGAGGTRNAEQVRRQRRARAKAARQQRKRNR